MAWADGHHDEVPESQQSLFCWAEFMAEESPREAIQKERQAEA